MSDSLEVPNYTVYELTALNPGYESLKNFSIGMFGGVNVIQYVKMQRELNVGEYND